MGDTRPDYEEFYLMARDAKETLDDRRVLVCPVDHGAFEDSKFLREPMLDAGLNCVWYERGPHTLLGRSIESAVDLWHAIKRQRIVKDDCIDQTNWKVFGEYRMVMTLPSEVENYIRRIGGVDTFLGFDDWADSGVSTLGIRVLGYKLRQRGAVKDVYGASSSDSTGGLVEFAARRPVERIYPTPETCIEARYPQTFKYLVRKGLIPSICHDTERGYQAPTEDRGYRHPSSNLVFLRRLMLL